MLPFPSILHDFVNRISKVPVVTPPENHRASDIYMQLLENWPENDRTYAQEKSIDSFRELAERGLNPTPLTVGDIGNLGALTLGGMAGPLGVPISSRTPITGREKLVQLYRSGPLPSEAAAGYKKLPEWLRQGTAETGQVQASGRWFVDDPKALQWYIAENGADKVYRMTLPQRLASKFSVGSNPEALRYSLDPAIEYFLPTNLANTARPFVP